MTRRPNVKLNMVIDFDDGSTVDVVATARDLRTWERQYQASWLGTATSETQFAQLAHVALQRTGRLPLAMSYEEFDAKCEDLTVTRWVAPVADPTNAAVGDTSSVNSPSDSELSQVS
jgi:hypothetical protein